MTEPSGFPEPLDNDDDDVAWALQTAKVQWNRGGHADALVWLRRAADSADQLGSVWRAADLRRIADELTANPQRALPPISQAPGSVGGSEIDDLLEEPERSGVTSLPPLRAAPAPLSSYAPVDVDDFEVDAEVDAEPFDEEVDAEPFDEEVVVADDVDPDPRVQQLLGDEVELTEEVESLDDDLLEEVSAGDALALDDAGEHEDPITQPQLEDPRFLELPRRSPLPPPRASRAVAIQPPPTSEPEIELDPEPDSEPESEPPLEPEPEADPRIGDVLLGEVRGLEDVPPEGQAVLAREARIEHLNAHEEISSFGLALVLRGAVSVMPSIADLSCARAAKGEIVWSEGNLEEGIALRLVASESATQVAVWESSLLKGAVRDYPWVVEDLKTLADRFQALAGVAMGPLGERLDDSLRAMVTERCEIKRLLPGEQLTTKGKPVGGMYIMAAGRIEVVDGDTIESEVGPGDFLFAPQVLSNGPAPRDSRAGKGGALLLFAGRGVAHELLLSVPPLLEIFAS